MEVYSVVSDMEEGGDYEDVESDGEEVEMTGPLEGRIFGGSNAVVKSKGTRRESSRLNAKRKAEKKERWRKDIRSPCSPEAVLAVLRSVLGRVGIMTREERGAMPGEKSIPQEIRCKPSSCCRGTDLVCVREWELVCSQFAQIRTLKVISFGCIHSDGEVSCLIEEVICYGICRVLTKLFKCRLWMKGMAQHCEEVYDVSARRHIIQQQVPVSLSDHSKSFTCVERPVSYGGHGIYDYCCLEAVLGQIRDAAYFGLLFQDLHKACLGPCSHTAIFLEGGWGKVTALVVAYEVNNVEFSTTGNELGHAQKGNAWCSL
ncbi:hypothetical protein F7725_009661 [Dissostichus mawsoni]|uniref:Uncharacterized protein n=1 Tax=Dissostichus mawsoni TaxID=36200 RepID=A0A7J5XM17_DISMA|nr:hypothetical protein F7725_009661 [Dissostichus mawsoni]